MTTRIDFLAQARNRALNRFHTLLLAGGSLAILAVTAWAFAGGTGIVYAIVFGTISMWLVGRIDPKAVLSMYKARRVGRLEFARGVAMVEELARRAGLAAAPTLHIVPSRMLNAFAVGRRDDSAIAITDQLALTLTGRELAGVLAHEISHIAHEDVKVMAFADMVSRFTSIMSTVGLFSLVLNLLGFAGGYEAQVPWSAVLVLTAAPTIGGLLQMALSRTREYDADLGAVLLTGDPDGLAMALLKLERPQGVYWESLVLPGSRTPVPSVLRTHPPTAERVARLMALKGGSGPNLPPPLAPQRRRVLIPLIPRAGRMQGAAVSSMLPEVEPFTHDEEPLRASSLCPPEGAPRIRWRRGGLYW